MSLQNVAGIVLTEQHRSSAERTGFRPLFGLVPTIARFVPLASSRARPDPFTMRFSV
jgi:hypothetical protein